MDLQPRRERQLLGYAGVVASGVGASRDEARFTDLDGDSRDDYLTVNGTGQVSAWLGEQFVVFIRPPSASGPATLRLREPGRHRAQFGSLDIGAERLGRARHQAVAPPSTM